MSDESKAPTDEKPAPATASQKERIKQIALVIIGAALGALGVELGVIPEPAPDCADVAVEEPAAVETAAVVVEEPTAEVPAP